MKFNTNLNLNEYIDVVNDIVNGSFNDDGQYVPFYGRIIAFLTFCNHCIELDNETEMKREIEDVEDVNDLMANKEIMDKYISNTAAPTKRDNFLNFKYAYADAMDIINYKKSDSQMIAKSIVDGVKAVLDSFKDSISMDQINEALSFLKNIPEDITSESIVKAYEDSDRFKEVMDKEDK